MKQLAGSELHTAELCRGFRRAGHEVSLFTPAPGAISDMLAREGFPVHTLANLRAVGDGDFDLAYLHLSTCEALLGVLLAGKVPLVGGYLGILPPLAKPVPGNFLSAATYLSEGVRGAFADRHEGIPSIIARNVYDDQVFTTNVALEPDDPRPDVPNFAVVTNHLDPTLAGLLEEAAGEGLCRFTHVGRPHNSVPVTEELLAPFDAVITIGRTVLLAAVLGKPVYVCDIYGADGWLRPDTFIESRANSFNGKAFAIKDRSLIRKGLLDVARWPEAGDLAWLRERVSQDYALSRRIEELESFFGLVVEAHRPDPAARGDGREGVIDFSETLAHEDLARRQRVGFQERKIQAQERKIQAQERKIEAQKRKIEVQKRKVEAQERKIEAQKRKIGQGKEALSNIRKRTRRLTAHNQNLREQLESIKMSKVWRLATKLSVTRDRLSAWRIWKP